MDGLKKPKEIDAVFCAINHGQCLTAQFAIERNEIIDVVKVKR